jgi:HD-GYP domain-containing protein (c-di-GMP phosphodiesterase class II)
VAIDGRIAKRFGNGPPRRYGVFTVITRPGPTPIFRAAGAAAPVSEASLSTPGELDLARQLERLCNVGIALSSETDGDKLMEMILREAKDLTHADGGTIYLRQGEPGTAGDTLRFAIMRTDSLGIALGGTTGKPITLPPVSLRDAEGQPNERNVASYAANTGRSINIADAYDAEGFDFTGTRKFDDRNGYRSKSMLAIPMRNHHGRITGVLQLLNAQDEATGETRAFTPSEQRLVEVFASQAAVALENQDLIRAQRELLESFIKVIAEAIDAKSPYTGKHCERVPIIAQMIAEAACEATEGPFAAFNMTTDERYQLRIGAWLHDCGKVTTPVHVMDKATKLETIGDRIETVRARFEVVHRDLEIQFLRACQGKTQVEIHELQLKYDAAHADLTAHLKFLEMANKGGEFMQDSAKARVRQIAEVTWMADGKAHPLLTEAEVDALCISRGTLTHDERLIINGHMVQTIRMLEALPFPPQLARVPEIACGHHEKMDGTGYPRGTYAGDLSIPARMMAVADVFEALTAADRPYKPPKKLSETMKIMGFMKKENHLDPEIFDLFVTSGVYRRYAERYMPPEYIDAVDEAALLAIKPLPFDAPDPDERARRLQELLPEYAKWAPTVGRVNPFSANPNAGRAS